jgi:methionyl-tRNA formyltransferase
MTTKVPSAELKVDGGLAFVGCGNSSLELFEVQIEGKKRMSSQDFINGYRPKTGERLGD